VWSGSEGALSDGKWLSLEKAVVRNITGKAVADFLVSRLPYCKQKGFEVNKSGDQR